MRMVARRTVLACCASAVILPAIDRPPPVVLRLGIAVPAHEVELRQGIAFGLREAERTAAMFGWRVEAVELDPAREAEVHAVIGVGTGSATGRLPYLRLRCDPHPSPGAFTIPRCDLASERDAAPARRIVAWHESLGRYGAAQLNDRYRATTGRGMTGDAWMGWMAVKILLDAVMRARTAAPDSIGLFLSRPETHFDGHKGVPLRFDGGRLLHPAYEIARRADGAWVVLRQIDPPAATP